MPERSNQHFVPQFYFRHFSGSDAICLLLRDTGKVILNAAIKGQCAKKNFYGSKELESLFSELESIHAQVVRRTIQVSWDETEMIFGHEEYCKLLQAILFQRARTSLETTKKAAAPAIMFLKLFRNHLEQIGEYKLVREIDEGNIKVLPNDRVIVALNIQAALRSVELITDMDMRLLLNYTKYPFIFGDSPVVFVNTYLINIKERGVLGLQSPGLQIFWPLNAWTTLMMYDKAEYELISDEGFRISIIQPSDIAQINALQMHHSLNAVYFGNSEHEEYVIRLWQAHKSSLETIQTELHMRNDWLIDGEASETILMHMLEPQINYNLRLSFLKCHSVGRHEFKFRYRNQEMVQNFREWTKENDL